MEHQKSRYKHMGSPLDEELYRYSKAILEEQDPCCLAESISAHFDVWPFKDFSLRYWREVSDRLLKILSSLEMKYFSDDVQKAEISGRDKVLLITIFRLLQRIFAYSKQKHSINVSDQVLSFIYSLDLEIVIEAYKVLVFSFYHSMGLDEFLEDQDMLFKCLELNQSTLNAVKTFNLSEQFPTNIPESSFEGGDKFDVLMRGTKKYGKANFIFKFRNTIYNEDMHSLKTLKILATCGFLTLLKGGSSFNEIAGKIDVLEIQDLVNDEHLTSDMEFAIICLLEALIYEGFDFSKISQILQLSDSNGFFYRRFAERFYEYEFEGHMIFFIYNTLIANQKSKYLKVDLLVDKLLRLRECSPDVRYHLLHALRSHSRETSSRGISEFISRNGVEVLFEYLRDAESCGFNEDANLRYVFKTLNEIYMRDGRHSMGVGNFEDSPFLDLVVLTIRNHYSLNTRLVSLCTSILTCFMFDEPLNFPVFVEKGADVVLDVFQAMDLTLEYASALISYIDAFSLNLEFQRRILEEEYLLKLLLLCKEEEFLGSGQGTNRIFSLLNVLVMHHPAFRKDILKFYNLNVRYLKNLFEAEIRDPYNLEDHFTRIFDGFFNLIEQMQIYPDKDDVDEFFDEISDLAINPRYSYNMQNFLRGSFREVYLHLYDELIVDKAKHFENLAIATKEMAALWREMLHDGVLRGYSWRDAGSPADSHLQEPHPDSGKDREVGSDRLEIKQDGFDAGNKAGHFENLMFSYDKQIALISLLCEESLDKVENKTKIRLFDVMAELFFVMVQFQNIFLPIADVSEHKFPSMYKSTRESLEESISRENIRLNILRSIYLCNRFLLQRLFPIMLSVSLDRTLSFTQELMEICFLNKGKYNASVCDSVVVLGLGFVEKLGLCFRPEHYEILTREEFTKNFFKSDLRSKRSRAIMSFFVSHLSTKLNEEVKLRHEFLRYLRDSEIDASADTHDVELSNTVIEAVGGIFGDWRHRSSPKISSEESSMILEIYEKFYTSPLCMALTVREVLRSSRYTMRLLKIRAFSSFQYFLKDDRRVYNHACFILNEFSEYSDEFIEMAGYILLFATINMCPHKINLEELGRKASDLIDSDVSFSKILFFLTMYFRLLTFLKVPKPQTFDFEKLITRVKTCDEMVQTMILFSYIIQPDMDGILDGLEFPSKRFSAEDGQFFRSNGFLIYRDYNEFVKKSLLKTDPTLFNTTVHFRDGCHKIYPTYSRKNEESLRKEDIENKAAQSNGLDKFLIQSLVRLLNSAECFDMTAQFLSEILFNNPIYLHELCEPRILEVVYKGYASRLGISEKHKLLGEAHWGIAFLINGLHSEVSLFKTRHPKSLSSTDSDGAKEFDLFGIRTTRSRMFSPISDFILKKIQSESNEDFFNAAFLLSRSLTPLFILKQESEEDRTIERFKEVSAFLEAIGFFEEIIKRINMVEEKDQRYSTCIQQSLDYLCLAFKYCYGEYSEDIDGYGTGESGDMEYYSVVSGGQDFVGSIFDTDESHFTNSPFYVESNSSTFVEEEGISDGSTSNQSENVVLIKTIDNNYEISTTMHMLKSEYYSIPSEIRGDVENLLCEKLYSDLLNENSSCYGKVTEDDVSIPRNMNCELDSPKVSDRACYENATRNEPESSSEDSLYCDENDMDSETKRATWGFNLAAESSLQHDSRSDTSEVYNDASLSEGSEGEHSMDAYSMEIVDNTEITGNMLENEVIEGSDESEVGSENGEIPSIPPETFNAMTEEELREALKEFFDERRALALTYVPLNISFYNQLSTNTRSAFEEMERIYRESFFYDIRIESSGSNDEGLNRSRIKIPEISREVFRRFLDKATTEEEFLFAKGWRLADILSRNAGMQKIIFEISSSRIESISSFAVDVCLLDEHTSMIFRRSLCLLLSIVKDSSGYDSYFKESPFLVNCIFNIVEKVRLTNELFRLIANFSAIFQQDKDFVFDRDVSLDKICSCFNKTLDPERFSLLEEFVENTARHFYPRFVGVFLKEIESQFGLLTECIYASPPFSNSSLANQKIFLRLWKMLAKMLEKNENLNGTDHQIILLMSHPFWNIFFECTKEKKSIEDLVNVSDTFEAFFIVGKIFDGRFEIQDTREKDPAKRKQWEDFRMFYNSAIEFQSQQINLLVEEQPERFFRNFNSLIKHSILSFSNKKGYLARKLRTENMDKSSSFYCVFVDREDVLRSSYFQIMAKSPEEFKTKRLEIKITGEEGLDYGGLTREWFGLLVKDLVDPNFALFEFSSEDKTAVVPCKSSYANPEHLSYFKFVGRIIAKAIMDGNFLNLHLSKFVYKHILGKNCDLEDLQLADPEFYNSLIWIRDNTVDESLRLTFSFDDVNLGAHRTVELVENGADIFVEDSNKMEYIKLATRYRLFNGIELQLSALRLGVFEILGEETLNMFNENELEMLICGVPDINVDDWKSNTLYYGYTESSKTIIWFWKAVKSFNPVEKAKLLQFVTGTSALPFEGFSHLQGNNEVQKFSIHRVSDKTDSLPTAHTCFNQLDLPEYSSYENLLRSLTLAISECSTGFGFI